MSVFSERLKTMRIANMLYQKHVAEILGVGTRTYQHYETGDREPSLDTLIKMAKLFHTSLDYLVGLVDAPDLNYDGRSDDPQRH